MRFQKLLVFLMFSVTGFGQNQQPAPSSNQTAANEVTDCPETQSELMNFCQVQKKYLDKHIVVLGLISDETNLFQWKRAFREGTRFTDAGDQAFLSARYKGQSGIVVAVQLSQTPSTKDIFGETQKPEEVINPHFDLVVRFADGTYGMLSTQPLIAQASVTLENEQQETADSIVNNQAAIVGSTLYACGYSHLYRPDSSLDEMMGPDELLKRLLVTEFPKLEPLKITTVKYFRDTDAVAIKVQLPDGQFALAVTNMKMKRQNASVNFPLLNQVSGTLLTQIPKDFTPKEIEGAKKGQIFRGMSVDALECGWGQPKKENDWGNGGKQLVFSDNLLVYLDNDNKVSDWQTLGN